MKKVMYFMLAGSLVFGMGACKKKGCTDSTATNYDSNAKKDDGSCTYAAAPTPDTEAPKVAIDAPAANTTFVAGTDNISLAVTITDNKGVKEWTYTVSDGTTEVDTKTETLSKGKSETPSATITVPADAKDATYTITVTAKDEAGNTSTAATVDVTIKAAKPSDTEKPKIEEPVQKYPATGTSISVNDGGKWDVKVTDNMDLSRVMIYLYDIDKSMNIDSVEEKNISGKMLDKKQVTLDFSDNSLRGDMARVVIKAWDAAGNEATLDGATTYSLN